MDRKRILIVATGRECWQQAMLLRPAFQFHDLCYLTADVDLVVWGDASPVLQVPDCKMGNRLSSARTGLSLAMRMIRFRPHVILSIGGLPGVLALAIGKRMGARTIWVDSIANPDEISPAGRKARPHADLWLSQWADVAQVAGAEFAGSVL